ncbi:restriction endonuclease subunit S [Methanococcoides sp. SA1]|nr:restriction endonuclease subunit S [Methanococcoides sp. SA1]
MGSGEEMKLKAIENEIIPANWNLVNVGDFVEIKHGYAFKGKYFIDEENDNLVLTPGNFHVGGGFKGTKFKYTTENYPEDYILKKDDIIVSMTDLSEKGDTLGYASKIPESNNKKFLHNQRLGLLKFNSLPINHDFLYWVLRNKNYNLFVVGSATGSTVKHTSPSRIKQYAFACPSDLREQKKIANLLSSLDDKITLNNQINQTLETMAQAIFKSWFVDFEPVKAKIAAIEAGEDAESVNRAAMRAISGRSDEGLDKMQAEQPEEYAQLKGTAKLFPAAMWDSELGEVPEGWGVKPFSDVIAVNPKRKLSKGQNATKISMSDIDCWQSWIERGSEDQYKSGPKFQNGDVLFARITPSLENGKTAYVNCLKEGEVGFGSTEFIVFGPKIILSSAHIYCLSRSDIVRETAIIEMTGTSGRQRVPNNCFDNLIIVNPPENIVSDFDKIIINFFNKIYINSRVSLNLTKIRDTLLPNLLSGELSVENIKLDEADA